MSANTMFENGDLANAKEVYKSIWSDGHNNEAVAIKLAEIASREGHLAQLVYYLGSASKLNPTNKHYDELYFESLLNARYFESVVTYLGVSQYEKLSLEKQLILIYSLLTTGDNIGGLKLWKAFCENNPQELKAPYAELISTIFFSQDLTIKEAQDKLRTLMAYSDRNVAIEATLALAGLQKKLGLLKEAEDTFNVALKKNFFTIAPVLAQFHYDNNEIDKAIDLLEVHLDKFNMPNSASILAELYILKGCPEKIHEISEKLQELGDKQAISTQYYLNALIAFSKKDFTEMRRSLLLCGNASERTQLAVLLMIMSDVNVNQINYLEHDFSQFAKMPPFRDYRIRATNIIADYLAGRIKRTDEAIDCALRIATEANKLVPDVKLRRIILECLLKQNYLTIYELNKALKEYPEDFKINKIAMQFFFNEKDYNNCLKIANYANKYKWNKDNEFLALELNSLCMQKKFDEASAIFNAKLSEGLDEVLLSNYWSFAVSTGRVKDFEAIIAFADSNEKAAGYKPFCTAALMLMRDKVEEALPILENSDTTDNTLLAYAGYILAVHEHNKAAIAKYEKITNEYRDYMIIQLNLSELYAAEHQDEKADELARVAWEEHRDSPYAQLCYAKRLAKANYMLDVVKVIRMPAEVDKVIPEVMNVWIPAMEHYVIYEFERNRIAAARQGCLTLQKYDKDNAVAAEYLQKILDLPENKEKQ